MTKIQFTIESEAYYSPEELEDLRLDLFEAAKKSDDEMVDDSASIVLVNEDEKKAEEAKVRASAIDLLNAGAISVTVIVQDEDGEVLSEAKLSSDDE